MKNIFDGLGSRLDMPEERLAELENMTKEITKSEKSKKIKKDRN